MIGMIGVRRYLLFCGRRLEMDDGGYLLLFEKNPHRYVFLCEEKKKRQIHQYLLSFSMQCVGHCIDSQKEEQASQSEALGARSYFPKNKNEREQKRGEREREREKSRDIHT